MAPVNLLFYTVFPVVNAITLNQGGEARGKTRHLEDDFQFSLGYKMSGFTYNRYQSVYFDWLI